MCIVCVCCIVVYMYVLGDNHFILDKQLASCLGDSLFRRIYMLIGELLTFDRWCWLQLENGVLMPVVAILICTGKRFKVTYPEMSSLIMWCFLSMQMIHYWPDNGAVTGLSLMHSLFDMFCFPVRFCCLCLVGFCFH